MDRFIQRSEEYHAVQAEYKQYTESHTSKEEGREEFPVSWLDYAASERTQFRLSGRDIGFVSLKSRDNCGGPAFTGELNALYWTKSIQFSNLSDLPSTALGQHQLIYAWDNDAEGNLDLVFSDNDEWITFVRILPDSTTRSFALHIPAIGAKC